MMDEADVSHSSLPQDDARDALARFYREIGISAVAAALQVTALRMAGLGETEAEPLKQNASAHSGDSDLAA